MYAAVTGPNLETRAEYRFLRTIGADVVGMSTVPEVIVAAHAGICVLGLAIVTDLCFPDALKPANIEDILATAAVAQPKLRKIVLGFWSRRPRSKRLRRTAFRPLRNRLRGRFSAPLVPLARR